MCLLLSPGTCRRRETRQLHLRNNTLLPVAWKLSGHDSMGDEFSFSSESGIVAPRTEFTLNVHFRAMKPNSYKRAVKLEVGGVKLPGNWRGGWSHVVRLEGWVESWVMVHTYISAMIDYFLFLSHLLPVSFRYLM